MGQLTSVFGSSAYQAPSTTPPQATLSSLGLARLLYFNVRDYGAIGDGVADDTAAITAAISAASSSVTGGGTVFLPPGQYLTSSTLTFPGLVSMVGSGWSASYIVPTDTAHDVIAVNISGVSKTFHHMFAGFAIYPKSNFSAGAGIHLGNSGKGTVRDVKIDGSLGGKPYYGVQLDQVSDTVFQNVRVEGTISDAWHLETANGATIVEIFWDAACTARSAGGWGMNVQPDNTSSGDIEGLHLEAMSFYQNTSGGVYLNANTVLSGKSIRNIHLNGTYLDTNTGPGLQTAGTATIENVSMQGVWCSNNGGYGLYLGSNLRAFTVTGGYVLLNGTDGIRVDGAQNGLIAGLLIKSNSQTTDLASYGLFITGSAQEVVFGNLDIYNDSGGYTNRQNGISVGSSVLDLDFYSCKHDTGSGTTKLSHNASSSARVRYANMRDNTGSNNVFQVKSGSSGSDVAVVDLFGNASFTGTLTTSGGIKGAIVLKTSNYNVGNTDDTIAANAASLTITLPAASSNTGRKYTICNTANGSSTSVASSGGTIAGHTSPYAVPALASAWGFAQFQSNGTDWQIVG